MGVGAGSSHSDCFGLPSRPGVDGHDHQGDGVPVDSQLTVTSRDRRTGRHNAGFGIAYGAMLMLGHTLIHPVIVLAFFVSLISDSYVLVGLVPALATGLVAFPLLLGAGSAPGRAGRLTVGVWASI